MLSLSSASVQYGLGKVFRSLEIDSKNEFAKEIYADGQATVSLRQLLAGQDNGSTV